jgi:hypothetical protein
MGASVNDSFVRIHIASGNVTETQDVDFCLIVCPNISADFYVLSKTQKTDEVNEE